MKGAKDKKFSRTKWLQPGAVHRQPPRVGPTDCIEPFAFASRENSMDDTARHLVCSFPLTGQHHDEQFQLGRSLSAIHPSQNQEGSFQRTHQTVVPLKFNGVSYTQVVLFYECFRSRHHECATGLLKVGGLSTPKDSKNPTSV